ncbi:hypothetical protein J1N35_012122 [Gossypium stocksii]|uniref:Reverse transcriptase domain-containing protein n=1 Tax=Gossypium stocksii TaxID=47602 RepID=A0A9D3W3B1_9ROSI|nr:hypothetical protein J1N35_012122 [Gossypium stocksii]
MEQRVFGNILKKKHTILAQLSEIQMSIEKHRSKKLVDLEKELQIELENERLKYAAMSFYRGLYTEEKGNMGKFPIRRMFPIVEAEFLEVLDQKLTTQEVHDALFGMAPLKAPGIDSLHAQFYQSQWNVVGESLVLLVKRVFENGTLERFFNKILLVLILKFVGPESITQFRPISLCTVPYKIITEVIVNRLKPLIPLLIAGNQTSFVGGQNIMDNIVIAQEVIHSMRICKGQKGCILK